MASPRDHRADREAGKILYPVVSRRSGGFSLGINLFPDRKRCNFDCPYCEVFPFENAERFSLDRLKGEFDGFLRGHPDAIRTVRDICISGNGEPTLSEHLPSVLDFARHVSSEKFAGAVPVVVITNGTGFLDRRIADMLADGANAGWLVPWVKVDAGTRAWFKVMSGTDIDCDDVYDGIGRWFARAPGIVQTMVCEVDGKRPIKDEIDALINRYRSLTASGNVREIHLYDMARSSPHARARPVGKVFLDFVSAKVRERIGRVPVKTFEA